MFSAGITFPIKAEISGFPQVLYFPLKQKFQASRRYYIPIKSRNSSHSVGIIPHQNYSHFHST